MARKLRKQRVALRFRRRQQLQDSLRTVLVRGLALALLGGFAFAVTTGERSVLGSFLRDHTPVVSVHVPATLTGLPAAPELPAQRAWLWAPGAELWLNRRLTQRYPVVRRVRVRKSWSRNEVNVHVDPRVPLVLWNGKGFDQDGVQFAVMPGAWKALPQADLNPHFSQADLGRWMARLRAVYPLWAKVQAFRQDAYGVVELTLKSGTSVIWGAPEKEPLSRKAQALLRVLDDMHTHSGGSARADLRFFDQGRIIVMPKSSK